MYFDTPQELLELAESIKTMNITSKEDLVDLAERLTKITASEECPALEKVGLCSSSLPADERCTGKFCTEDIYSYADPDQNGLPRYILIQSYMSQYWRVTTWENRHGVEPQFFPEWENYFFG